jgi:hypothetical protein
MPTVEELHAELAPAVLEGLEGDERVQGDALLATLLGEWIAEAEASGIGDRVLAILRSDLDKAIAGAGPGERLAMLDAWVLERELRVVSRASLALGKQVIDGVVSDDEARERGQAVLARVQELAPRIERIAADRRAPLRRQLEDAMLEALYALERKAMSSRLNLYLRDKQGGGPVPPPAISP